MDFSLYWGRATGAARWRAAVERHARWLGASVTVQGDGILVARVVRAAPQSNAVAITVGPGESCVEVAVPPATPQQCQYAWTPDGLVVSDDLRLFPRLIPVTLDERALHALFAFGAIPPDFTLYREVRRAPGGHRVRFTADRRVETTLEFCVHPDGETSPETAERRVAAVLDDMMSRLPPDSLLYFSGGVDSSLLAARAARMGRRDLRLVNYRFGPQDGESDHARRLAQRLGFSLHEVDHTPDRLGAVLERIGLDYSFPFGDLSAVPTNLLVHASLDWAGAPPAVVEGTGADGAFGVGAGYARYRSVYRVPRWLRLPALAAFRHLRLWRRRSRLERATRFLRRSVLFSLEDAVLALNALEGIAYTVARSAVSEVEDAVRRRLHVLSDGAGPQERLSLIDLAWVCAGRMAPKSFDPLRRRGATVLYPYLEPAMIGVSSALPWSLKGGRSGREPKALLKQMLARDVPGDWVYRPKSGFTPPYAEMFSSRPLQDFVREVTLAAGNPVLDACNRPVLTDMMDTARRTHLSPGAYDLLWSLTFVSAWLAQTPREAER